MKHTLIMAAINLAIASCGNNTSTDSITTDSVTSNTGNTVKPVLHDTIPHGNSSSSSEFSKGNTSPAGSTGVIDSSRAKSPDSMGIKKVNDKKARRDSTQR